MRNKKVVLCTHKADDKNIGLLHFHKLFQVLLEKAITAPQICFAPLYKLPPGWEINIQELQELPQRYCFIKNKAEGGVIVIYTPDMPYPWQLPPQARGELGGGATEEEFKETIKKAQIGVKYYKDRKKIAREYKERLEKLTASKEPKTFREPKKRDKNLTF